MRHHPSVITCTPHYAAAFIYLLMSSFSSVSPARIKSPCFNSIHLRYLIRLGERKGGQADVSVQAEGAQ